MNSNSTRSFLTDAIVIACALLFCCSPCTGQSAPQTDNLESFWIVGNARIPHGPWHERLLSVFIAPPDFTIDNIKAVFRRLSEEFPSDDHLMIYASSDRSYIQEEARQLSAIQAAGKAPGRADAIGVDWPRLSASYSRNDDAEYLHFYPQKGRPIHQTLRSLEGCPITGDPAIDLVLAARQGDDCAAVVKHLLDSGANPNVKSRYGGAALVEAAFWGRDEIIKLLLERGADINQTSASGWTPLIAAISLNRASTIELLMTRGANLNLRSEDGRTALLAAVLRERIGLVKELLARGADFTMANAGGKTVLVIAEELRNVHIIQLLKGAGATQ